MLRSFCSVANLVDAGRKRQQVGVLRRVFVLRHVTLQRAFLFHADKQRTSAVEVLTGGVSLCW